MTDNIKKAGLTLAALAALGFGGAQIANATSGSTTPAAGVAAEAPDGGDHVADAGNDPSEAVTGTAAAKAKAAALAAVPGGKVTGVQAERADDGGPADTPEPGDRPDAGEQADTPEPGDQPDPAYESKIAYDVEVTAADGTITDVHLDRSFSVLGMDQEGAEGLGD